MWKLKNISATQIYMKSKCSEFSISKSAIFSFLEALHFDFWQIFAILKGQELPNLNFEAFKTVKMAAFRGSKNGKFDFT